jgi:hypothetical protein
MALSLFATGEKPAFGSWVSFERRATSIESRETSIETSEASIEPQKTSIEPARSADRKNFVLELRACQWSSPFILDSA